MLLADSELASALRLGLLTQIFGENVFGKYREKAKKSWFNFQIRQVVEVPPTRGEVNSNFSILSQLHSPDLLMYLLAVKSFTRFAKPKKYYIVDDGLNEKDHEILNHHLEHVEFIPIESVELGTCPKGGCWERLASIAGLNQDSFIVQLDADTLTLQRPVEVLCAIKENRSFTLGTGIGREIISANDAAKYASENKGGHIQLVAEAALSEYPDSNKLHYVRGCAGFAGFSPGAISLQALSSFSERISEIVGGEKWWEWGSEQFASNFFIANSKDPHVLTFESYPYMNEKTDVYTSDFIHFVGSHRFKGGVYAKLGRKIIDELLLDSAH